MPPEGEHGRTKAVRLLLALDPQSRKEYKSLGECSGQTGMAMQAGVGMPNQPGAGTTQEPGAGMTKQTGAPMTKQAGAGMAKKTRTLIDQTDHCNAPQSRQRLRSANATTCSPSNAVVAKE